MKILSTGIAVADNDQWISNWVEQSGRLDHDQNLLPVILPYIKPGDWVIDGGAFIGDHTIAYEKAVGPEGRVFAFEPNSEAYQCLRHNCKQAWKFNAALGNQLGHVSIVQQDNRGASYAVNGANGQVPMIPLDFFNFPRLNFLKLDVEGFELEAIKGAHETIKKHKPIILAEINDFALRRNGTSPVELIGHLCFLGYDPRKVYESDTLEAPMFDLLFIPTGGL